MKQLLAVLALSAMVLNMGAAMADDLKKGSVEENVAAADVWEKGEFTTQHPVASRVVTLPFRLVTGAVGAPVGGIRGFVEGAHEGVMHMHKVEVMPHTETTEGYPVANTTATFLKTAVLVPVKVVGYGFGLVGGGAAGLAEGATRGAVSGFMVEDQM